MVYQIALYCRCKNLFILGNYHDYRFVVIEPRMFMTSPNTTDSPKLLAKFHNDSNSQFKVNCVPFHFKCQSSGKIQPLRRRWFMNFYIIESQILISEYGLIITFVLFWKSWCKLVYIFPEFNYRLEYVEDWLSSLQWISDFYKNNFLTTFQGKLAKSNSSSSSITEEFIIFSIQIIDKHIESVANG